MLFPSSVINAALMGRTQGISSPEDDIPIATPELWFKAEELSLANGAEVSQWDSVGSTLNISGSQATSANRPTYQTAVINGLPIVRFASGDFLTLNDDLIDIFTGSPTNTLVAVLKPTPQAASSSFFSKAGSGGNQFFYDVTPAGLPQFGYHDNTGWHYGRVEQSIGNAFHVVLLFYNAPAVSAGKEVGRIDGAEVADTVAAASGDGIGVPNTAAPINIGIRDGGFNPFVGDIAELLIYDRLLDYPAEAITVEQYFMDKYAIV